MGIKENVEAVQNEAIAHYNMESMNAAKQISGEEFSLRERG